MSAIDQKLENHATRNRVAPDSTGDVPGNTGVTVAYLALAFRMDARTVKERLKSCPIHSYKNRGTKMKTILYDLATAASYLVTPALTSKDYLRAVKRNELPAALQQQVWDALLKRQRWEENAGELWRTENVRAVLGSTFQTIKFQMQLWLETLERQVEVSPAQRKLLMELVDGLQKEIYDALVKQGEESETGPQTGEMQDLVGESGSVAEIIADMNSPEPEAWESLV